MTKHQHGGDIYSAVYEMDYSANINPLGTPKSVIEAACKGVLKSQAYPDVQYRELKEGLQNHEGVKEEQIICGNGAADLIFSIVNAVKPKKALLIAPGFVEYEQALLAAGCTCDFFMLKEEEGFCVTEDYLEAITEEIEMVFLCNPSNPTGTLCHKEFLEKVLRKCQKVNAMLVLDECFNDFLEAPKEYTMKAYLKDYPNLFILKAFTKIYAMAGLRLGYGLCGNQKLLDKMAFVTQPWNISIPAQMAGVAALHETGYVESSKILIREERRFLRERLENLGWKVYDSEANFLFFYGPKGLKEEFAKRGVLIRDCSNYRGLREGYYRIAVRTHMENEVLVEIAYEITSEWKKQEER